MRERGLKSQKIRTRRIVQRQLREAPPHEVEDLVEDGLAGDAVGGAAFVAGQDWGLKVLHGETSRYCGRYIPWTFGQTLSVGGHRN